MRIQKEVWVIMDKAHKAVACGVPRNRYLALVDTWDGSRLLTYTSQKRAEAAFKIAQFYLGNAEDYMTETYNNFTATRRYKYNGKNYEDQYLDQSENYADIYEAVKVSLVIENND